ncbi:hypothetical protein, unlikely [Trypanosoma brucei gambiense DAL972]|uniref:Uncharacterized protein n=1 Tax=Trypanosoma brucei gambiense (strain MHOM/CI/86/DAL972) TaxID=679716 RepID=C9ZU54_TRYB9|nr:hypothetical protein, unlikely [Trypanosoma brucei gambiense DAL972]XP_011775225.1 hypothetical protein, unlikely [Trypanosoma brucei gambiense DAL972]CBH12940.1 hypothetical protein, unlikely [Trypanosoma brucei gambiense DAL972]CBH12946.1 hypothetical protein, unlikely [Trypanosoma brucei gambiense DAL972]|eukprot:XP_011775219.1 hypothetical protein, unlikely [Trypanosoma brucei gambiense DAL972]
MFLSVLLRVTLCGTIYIYVRQCSNYFLVHCVSMCVCKCHQLCEPNLSLSLCIYIFIYNTIIFCPSPNESTCMGWHERHAPRPWGSRGTLRPEALNLDAWNFMLRDF